MFSVLGLGFLVILFILLFFCNFLYLKYLVVLIYLRGIVIFILYISCMCWHTEIKLHWIFLIFSFRFIFLYDRGRLSKIFDVGEYLWIFLFFGTVFRNLVNLYSLNLFKVSGSLRF